MGIWTGPLPVGDMDRPVSGQGYGLTPFELGIWTDPFLGGNMDRPVSGWGYGLGVLPYFLHCIASQVDTFVCHTERFVVLKKPAFFLCFSSMHTCLLYFDNYDVVT